MTDPPDNEKMKGLVIVKALKVTAFTVKAQSGPLYIFGIEHLDTKDVIGSEMA